MTPKDFLLDDLALYKYRCLRCQGWVLIYTLSIIFYPRKIVLILIIALSWVGGWAHSLRPKGREGDGEERLITHFSCTMYIHNFF